MAYEKTEWKSGDTITAEKLNNIESGVKDNENGWEVENEYELILEEEVTTKDTEDGYARGYFSNSIDDNLTIRVTFNGNEYECIFDEAQGCYGAVAIYNEQTQNWEMDFSNYPFMISSEMIITQTAGTYTVKIEKVDKKTVFSEDFKYALNDIVGLEGTLQEVFLGNEQSFTLVGQDWTYTYETFGSIDIQPYKSIIVYFGNDQYSLNRYVCNYDDGRWIPENSTDFYIYYDTDAYSSPIIFNKTQNSTLSGRYYLNISIPCRMVETDDLYYYYLLHKKLYNESPILQLPLIYNSYYRSFAQEGNFINNSGYRAVAFGYYNTLRGTNSFAIGQSNTANGKNQFVFGQFNSYDNPQDTENKGDHIEIVGNGKDSSHRSNARTLDWQGNETLAGNITLGGKITLGKGTADEVTLTAAQVKQLLALLNN